MCGGKESNDSDCTAGSERCVGPTHDNRANFDFDFNFNCKLFFLF